MPKMIMMDLYLRIFMGHNIHNILFGSRTKKSDLFISLSGQSIGSGCVPNIAVGVIVFYSLHRNFPTFLLPWIIYNYLKFFCVGLKLQGTLFFVSILVFCNTA